MALNNISNNRKKVCYIVCYKDPNYVRSATILSSLSATNDLELFVVKNRHKRFMRYPEILLKLIKFRMKNRADIYFVGFRGHESFWAFYPFMRGSVIIFDEFVNMHDWIVNEHKKLKEDSLLIKFIDEYTKWIFRRTNKILTDTRSHKLLCAETYSVNPDKIVVVPLGAEDDIFKPLKKLKKGDTFEVFFYGNMLPLHGTHVILDSILELENSIHLTIVGGKNNLKMIHNIENFIKVNNLEKKITYLKWVPYLELPGYIAKADLCLGGPFGGTGQGSRVVTGKTYQFIAMGKATVIGESEESIFIDKSSALICKQNSPSSLARTINWAFNNQSRLSDIGAKARKLYLDNYSKDRRSYLLNSLLDEFNH